MPNRDVVILSAVRTPIGKYGGSFKDVHPAELGAVAARAAIHNAGIEPSEVDEVWIGHGRQAGSGPNPARQVAFRAGLPDTVVAQTINKACASGLQALASGAQAILLGEADVVLVGGIESMSRMPHMIDSNAARWGHRMGHVALVDAMYRDGFRCPLSNLIMGETAEVLARQYGITRADSDSYALESQRRAEVAIKAGKFRDEIVPVEVTGRDGETETIDSDEHPRFGLTIESLKKLTPVFDEVEGQPGIVTAGSSSGITDGGAALMLTTADRAKFMGRVPLAKLSGWASAGVDPRIMGIGPVPAIHKLCQRLDLPVDAFDLVELNEAFAAQVLAVLRDVPINLDRLNVNGGAIALGHPIGCTGSRIVVTLLHEMRRRAAFRGLATLCVSGGMGMALAVERP